MKAGCYLTLALLTGLILAYHQGLQHVVPSPEAWYAAGGLGTAVWFCVGALWNAWQQGGMVRALRNALDGLMPVDGQLSAVAGVIQPYERPIVAPMSETPCVIYEYEISRTQRTQKETRTLVDFAGIGMTPCEIQTDQQVIVLCGFPDLDSFPSQKYGVEGRGRARDYVRRTEWADCSGLRAIRGFSSMLQAITSAKEEIHRDFRMVGPGTCPWLRTPLAETGDDPVPRSSDDYFPTITEKRIAVGQPVVALGVYDASAEMLTTRAGTNFQRLQLLKGSLDEEYAKVRASRKAYVIGGLIGLIVVHLIAAGVLALYLNSLKAAA